MNGIEAIGVQQYMFRDHFRTEAEAAETLKRIRETGFEAVEMCDVLMDPGKSPKGTPYEIGTAFDWPGLFARAGLGVFAIHDALESIMKDPEGMAGKARALGARYLVAAVTLETDFGDADSVTRLIADLNGLGKTLKRLGAPLLYHNHNMELERPGDGRPTALGRMIDELDPDYVRLELDAFWIQNAGADPVRWCERARGKLAVLHINDCKVPHAAPGHPIRTAKGTELGRGNMELDAVFSAAIASGCESVILETHDNWIDGDPFLSSRVSYETIRSFV